MNYFMTRSIIFLVSGLLLNLSYAEKAISFNNALKHTYRHNPKLQSSIQEAEKTHGEAIQNGLWLNPSFQLEVENIGGSGAYQGYESAETTFSVNQPLPLGGKRSWLQKASLARYSLLKASILRKKSELYMETGERYINAYYANQWHIVTKKLVQLNKDIVNEIKRRQKAGVSAELDLRLAEIALGEAEIQQSRAYRQTLIQLAMLAELMGKTSLSTHKLLDKGLPHHDIEWQTIKKRINKSIFIEEKKAELSARRIEITSIKKNVWPTIQLQLGGRHFSDDNENAIVASVNSVIPVFNRNQGNIFSAEAAYTQSLQNLKATKLFLYQRLTQAFLELQQNSEETHMVKTKLLPNAKKASKLAMDGYQKGLYSYIELSNAMKLLYEEEHHYQEAHAKRDIAMIKITGLLSKGVS